VESVRGGVVVVGSANADLVVGVARHPAPGETVLGTDLEVHPGGKGANQAVAAARLGARVAFVGRVGRDAHGELLVDALTRDGVDTSALDRDGAAPTGVALITVGAGGENAIVVSPGANSRLTAADAERAVRRLDWGAVVSAQLEIPPEAVAAAARAARERGARFMLNPSPPDPLTDEGFAREVLPLCDPLVVNEHEARLLVAGGGSGTDDEEEVVHGLLRLGARSAVVTLGERGALVAGRTGHGHTARGHTARGRAGRGRTEHGRAGSGEAVHVPGVRVEAVDTKGAGDAFTGALGWRLCEDPDLVEATRWAVRAGAAAVRGHGAQSSYPGVTDLPGQGPPGGDRLGTRRR
jgi:ribokinase